MNRILVNRLKMPTKHILVCEDDIDNQIAILVHLRRLFDPQGEVLISVVGSGFPLILISMQIDLIILDHDMPWGMGDRFLKELRSGEFMKLGLTTIPVLTFSGLNVNNENLIAIGGDNTYKYNKIDILSGLADKLINKLLFGKK